MADRPRDASASRFASDRAGQASTVGTALLLVITLVGTGLIVTLGGGVLDDTQQSADVSRVEHSMTMFDSRAAVVALEESDSQSARFGAPDSGTFRVDEDAGRMTVVHHNYTGQGHNETLYDGSLGAVVYENGDTTVAYQGGGVWRSDGGASTMVSPPEFHYRGSTLTLPAIQVEGDDSATGGSTASITSAEASRSVYPNSSATYDNEPRAYTNPVENGTVTVTVEGEYYQGWARYFRTRTDGNVTVDHEAQTATVELVTTELVGEFQFPGDEDEPIPVRDLEEGHTVDVFDVTVSQDEDGNKFNEMYFSFWADEGGDEFEMVIYVPGGGGDICKTGSVDVNYDLTMDVYYYDSANDTHHSWTNDSIAADTGDVRLRCYGQTPKLEIDYTSDTQELDYADFSTKTNHWEHDPVQGDRATSVNFTAHGDDPSDDPLNSASLDLLTNHYFALLGPDMDLKYNHGPGGSGPIEPSDSVGVLEYGASSENRFLTFLHITENRIVVEFR